MNTHKLFAAIVAFFLAGSATMAQAPKREMRSVWLTTVWNIDWPYTNYRGTTAEAQANMKQQLTDYLDDLQSGNFNCVFFQVRSRADVLFKSNLEPWCITMTGVRGTDPGWDPLAFAIEECHKRGMEIYAWVNPFRYDKSANIGSTSFDTQWNNAGWLFNNSLKTETPTTVFNPGKSDARQHILDVIKEIYNNYMVDGIVFDDYFYPGGGMLETYQDPDYQDYMASGTSLTLADWRRNNINTFIQEVYKAIQTDRPDMKFGVSPAGVAGASATKWGVEELPSPTKNYDWQYGEIYSDPLAWLHDGSIDFISPQLYWEMDHSTNGFALLSNWWYKAAKQFNRHFYASHDVSDMVSSVFQALAVEIGNQVAAYRQSVADGNYGQVYYSTRSLYGDQVTSTYNSLIGPYLGENYYTGASITPCVTWKEHYVYDAPANLMRASNTLQWEATTGQRSNSIIRYTVYAVPIDVDYSNAVGTDGIDGQYLLGLTYDTSFEIPAAKQDNYYYAVCVFDGYGYESEPAFLGLAVDPSEATSLIAPENGTALTEQKVTFSWQEVADASYRLEISKSVSFTNKAISQSGITETSIELNLASLDPLTTYYWRVVTTQSGKKATPSDAATFTTVERTVGNIEAGYYIQKEDHAFEDATFDLQNLWMRTTSLGNFSASGTLCRGMVATKDRVYVTARSANSSTADIYLLGYDALTGEKLGDWFLWDNAKCGTYPNNDISVDGKGVLCITNLSTDISTTPLKVYTYDPSTTTTTEVASITGESGSERIDYASVLGDVAGGDFYVFAAVANSTKVYRWLVQGSTISTASLTAKEFFPTSATGWATAPRVYPVNYRYAYVDGSNTGVVLYDFKDGTITDKPASAFASYSDNGMASFTMGEDNFIVYAANSSKHQFTLKQFTLKQGTLASGVELKTLPLSGLGTNVVSSCSAPCSAVVVDESLARFYVYSPDNGLAAYQLVNKKTSGVENVAVEEAKASISGLEVTFDQVQSHITAYNLSGAQVATATNSATITLPTAGYYIIVTPTTARKIQVK